MKKLNKRIISKICIFLGASLLVFGMLVLVCWQWNIYSSIQNTESYLQTIRTRMPTPQSTIPEERKDNTMPVFSVDGINFAGILEMPRYDSALPICADWGRITKYPCRFDGSVYNRTIQIGATSQKGQYDFYREISVGDTIFFTDMEGNRYTYVITNLCYEKHADQATLANTDSALTLFIKIVYDFEYLIVSCDILN